MQKHFLGGVLAGAIAVTATVAAQTPPPAPQTKPMTQSASSVTVEGCVIAAADAPGVPSASASADSFVLTNTKIVKGTPPAGASTSRPSDTPTGTTGAQSQTYKVAGIDNAELKSHAGHRVQIEGSFSSSMSPSASPSPSASAAKDLLELRGTTIKQVPGDCPSK
jgi:hypothetical protein